jgi:hypothetical protein
LRRSVKDAGGVIPGVEVTLNHDPPASSARRSPTKARRVRVRRRSTGNYAVRRPAGYKTVDRGAIRIGTQQFLTLDLTMESARSPRT